MNDPMREIGERFETAARAATGNPELWVPGIGNGALGGVLTALVEHGLTDQEIGRLVRAAVTGEQSPDRGTAVPFVRTEDPVGGRGEQNSVSSIGERPVTAQELAAKLLELPEGTVVGTGGDGYQGSWSEGDAMLRHYPWKGVVLIVENPGGD